jgi:Fe-S cluster biogenesis protein NfuA
MTHKIDDAASNPTPSERITEVIDMLRPYIQGDGGDIEFVDFTDDGIVHVRLHGACRGCPGATMTLTMGVEAQLRQAVPEVRGVARVD